MDYLYPLIRSNTIHSLNDMPAYQTNRMRFNSTRYKRKASPYSPYSKRARLGRAIIKQGGVAGGVQRMTAGLPSPQEIKNFDSTISICSDTDGNKFQISPSDLVAGIIQGTGDNERVGRTIRVVGVVLRVSVFNASPEGIPGQPYIIDMLWDSQCNGAEPAVTDVYTSVLTDALPNTDFSKRFQFFKRFSNPASYSSDRTIINASLKCNRLVEFKASNGALADLTSTNLLVYAVCPVGICCEGTLRVLYVDA